MLRDNELILGSRSRELGIAALCAWREPHGILLAGQGSARQGVAGRGWAGLGMAGQGMGSSINTTDQKGTRP